MPTNNRVYFPLAEVSIGPYCSASGLQVHGVQSVSLTTSFNLEQVFELGQLEIYENIENLPNIEMTVEKALDGYGLVYHFGTRGATAKTLANRTNQRADVILSIFHDAQDNASGQPMAQAYCSGMYVNSLNYTLPVQGSCTESVTFVGNDKIWKTSSFLHFGHFVGGDAPSDGIQRRQMVKMGSPSGGNSVWPTNIPGMTTFQGSGYNVETAGVFGAHVQDVTISTSLGREDLFELGRRKPYYRYANFPTAVDCTINLTPAGTNPGDAINANSEADNLSNEAIQIHLNDGTVFDLGNKNKLQSVTYNGDTGGGVFTMSYAYQNFNVLSVTHPEDPEHLT
jgi:hypothetical protein